MRKLFGAALAAALILPLAACGSSSSSAGTSDGTVKIALLDALSGNLSTYGKDASRGTILAVDQLNETGFVVAGKRYHVELDTTDIQSDPAVAAQKAQQVVQSGTKFIVAPLASDVALPVATAAQRGQNVIVLSGATAVSTFLKPDGTVFKTIPAEATTAQEFVKTSEQQFPQVKNVSVLMANDAVGQSLIKIYPPAFKADGAKVVSTDTFPTTETNFSTLLQRVPASAQGVFMGYNPTNTAAIMDAANEAGRKLVFFDRGAGCQNAIDREKTLAGYTCPVYTEDPNHPSTPVAKQYFATYKQKFGPLTGSAQFSLLYYDYVKALIKAMQDAGTVTDTVKIADAYRSIHYQGVLDVSFSSIGESLAPINVGVVKNGTYNVVPAVR